jgi:fused signal recognition particle receptor
MRFADRLKALFSASGSDDVAFYDELTDVLVEGDLGGGFAAAICAELQKACGAGRVKGQVAIKKELKRILRAYGREISISPDSSRLNVFLVLGVNGVGKTTSCAKLAHFFGKSKASKRIVLAAGDTFRAAAIEQLRTHGERLGMRVVGQIPGADPAAVIFDAISAATADGSDTVIADTAGRMHTRTDLVRELSKIDRVISVKAPEASIKRLLVLDATTGQNGIRQAEVFSSAVTIDGIVLSKYDSTSRGGIVLSLAKGMGLPTAFIGTGEGYDDINSFSLDRFLDDFIGIAN